MIKKTAPQWIPVGPRSRPSGTPIAGIPSGPLLVIAGQAGLDEDAVADRENSGKERTTAGGFIASGA